MNQKTAPNKGAPGVPLDKIVSWFNASEATPPDCSSYAICAMYLVNNGGFVTIGFWYPKVKEWMDANHKYKINVSHWAKMPDAPR